MWSWFRSKPLATLAKPLDIAQLRKRAKILVIDDDPNAFPVQVLKDEGYTIDHWTEVTSLERLERGDFDVIVLDIAGVATKFTKMDGLGILEHLKQANPTQIVVAFSGQSFDLGKNKFFRLADDALAKPVDALKCKQVLDHLLETKFTVAHLWDSVVHVLKRENVADTTIRTLETKLATAITKGTKPDLEAFVGRIVKKAELVTRITGLLSKIGALAGL